MLRGDDAEYQRRYHTLGSSTRRLSNPDMEAYAKLHKGGDVEHQRNKNPPQHAATLVNTNCARQQQPHYWSFKARTPRGSAGLQQQTLGEQGGGRLCYASAESLESMADAEIPLGFSRSNILRQSLPLARSPSQAKLRAPAVLFLQFGDETHRVHITHELTSMETLHALIVHMFPQKLTMGALRSHGTALLIKDEARNIFYELEDPRDIHDRCLIKIYCREAPIRDPHYNTQHTPHPVHHGHITNGDLRRELVYTSRESSPTRRMNTLPSSSPSSGSPSHSQARLSYTGGRPSSYAGPHPSPQLHHYQHQHHAHSAGHAPQQQGHTHPAFCPSPSAILERRDVKPDEEITSSSKSVVLLKNEAIYADPYTLVQDPRISIASQQALAYRRGSVRSLGGYPAAALQCELEGALYRPGGPIYVDPYATMGFRTLPPGSPQKLSDSRDPYGSHPGRGSPGRHGLRKDGTVFIESPKNRPGGQQLEQICMLGGPGGDGGPVYGSTLHGNEETRERMEAMEKQIASLTGLVQSVLTRGPDSPEKAETASDCSAPEISSPSTPLALMPPPPSGVSQPIAMSHLQMQLHLTDLQQHTVELRKQLTELRQLQLQNQDSVQALLRQTESDLGMCLIEASRTQEDPLQRQRLLVEEERLRYLNEEELIIQQLHDLERSVEEMRVGVGLNHNLVTQQEIEQKSLELRRLGETVTYLKNQFPTLQCKMRVVLRVEVEAVKFLKEEPLRLEALLKRCRNITNTLAVLRRQVSEGVWRTPDDFSSSVSSSSDVDFSRSSDLDILNSPSLNLPDLGGTLSGTATLSVSLGTNTTLGTNPSASCLEGTTSLSNVLGSSVGGTLSSSGMSGCTTLGNWLAGAGATDPIMPEMDSSSAGAIKTSGLEDLPIRRESDKGVSVEVRLAAERDWEEKRASLTQFSAQDINRLLEETQAKLMKAIPDLDFAAKQITKPAVPPKPQLSSLPAPGSTSSTPSLTPEHHPSKTPPKPLSKDSIPRRGSGELTVQRYRTEKPSKSPPPPPPRRSFPSALGLTTNSSGDVITISKSLKKTENKEDADVPTQSQTPPIKLRRPSTSDGPSSTPPVIAASGMKEDEDEDEKIMAELEPVGTPPGSAKLVQPSAASRLRHLQQSSLERRNRKQQEEFPKLQQGQQQVFHF
ncbi:SRC kinase signaling inhibitor 1-like isoform X1 [Xyrauchen texanus]|uniref:SRC kinase signaling inhibitor 1-like isoform X1 n=2 Tax=Xyrauchen texanus TaxID=154827 RepID=UPI002242959E|nr:SRC kinase signaling inhibitor 1-like isoform X1 [Xyrauchen texanus]XP_051969541.1 SRC kinase signaling inhibitor 1-like isoform X1 [Xyrauchen texanus]XP_051969542.1 SRC kinase signaling inhibitor 1-like isoform X1 [Xyrauchen texanus]XP_051969543.1 SRC kinase signaling inhibitor 1-like isoform X1 [Xyrauchen texanus]